MHGVPNPEERDRKSYTMLVCLGVPFHELARRTRTFSTCILQAHRS